MGKGRDKRKKHEDPAKAAKRASRQAAKCAKASKHADPSNPDGGAAPFEDGFNNEEAIETTLKNLKRQEGKKKTTVEKDNVAPPSSRANVVFVPHPLREHELVIFGGELWNGVSTTAYNDLYIYNVQKLKWALVDTPVNPSPRSSSQGVVYKHLLVIFGGEFVSQTQSQFMHFKDVWRFDFKTYQWDELKLLQKGGPPCRSGHRMCLWKRQAVMFGGFYDNAQECRYYNDMWILSELEANGRWRLVQFPLHNDPPHARSGHAIGVHQDTLFVYGGYSSQKFNRFKKSEATVHHDLWSTNLAAEQPVWTKIRLGGIPPPIRAGVSAVTRDKQMYLFGGVVDIEAPGGKMVSTFHNDLFALHMDTQRFYPLVLQARKKQRAVGAQRGSAAQKPAVGATLEAELASLHLKPTDTDDETSSASSEEDNNEPNADTATAAGGPRLSYEVTRDGQILPHRRMDAALCTMGNHLYLFGGQFESGKKEITITDLFSLNLNVRDTWTTLCAQDLGECAWAGKDSDSEGAASWESGSTVVSGVMFGDCGGSSDDEDEEEGKRGDDDVAPDAIPAELDHNVTPGHDELGAAAGSGVDGRTMGRGKKGMQAHKAQLLAQLGVESLVPTPQAAEPFNAFFERTQAFWLSTAAESLFGGGVMSSGGGALSAKQQKQCKSEGAKFCRSRYEEAIVLMEQLRLVEERELEEAAFFKKMREDKERAWQAEEEARLAAEMAEEGSQSRNTKTSLKYRTADAVPAKGILKSALQAKHTHSSDEEDGSSSSSSSDSDASSS